VKYSRLGITPQVGSANLQNLVHASQIEDDFASDRNNSTDKVSPSSARDYGDLLSIGKGDDFLNFFGCTRPYHE
jgi:hypothetical protein